MGMRKLFVKQAVDKVRAIKGRKRHPKNVIPAVTIGKALSLRVFGPDSSFST
jgi:hypothetical protein